MPDSQCEEGWMAITKGQLNLAGWLSITNAIFAIPSIAMSWFLDTIGGAGAKLSQAILTLVSLGLFLYVIISLRKLLNYRFQFHEVDIYISLLIWGNAVLAILSLLSLGDRRLEGSNEFSDDHFIYCIRYSLDYVCHKASTPFWKSSRSSEAILLHPNCEWYLLYYRLVITDGNYCRSSDGCDPWNHLL